MRRTLAALVAAAALGIPATAAEAVTVCPGVGGTYETYVCVGADLNGSGNTVDPQVGWGCTVLATAACAGATLHVGTTGIDPAGHVYVAGRMVL